MVDGLNQFAEVDFDPTAFPQRLARRPTGRPLDTLRADPLADLGHVHFQISTFIHAPPDFLSEHPRGAGPRPTSTGKLSGKTRAKSTEKLVRDDGTPDRARTAMPARRQLAREACVFAQCSMRLVKLCRYNYWHPSASPTSPPTLRRSACCLNATQRQHHPTSPPTLCRSACCLNATQRQHHPTSPPTLCRSACCLNATQRQHHPTSPPTLRRSACCLTATQRQHHPTSPPTLRRSACCLKATSAQRNSAPHRPCVGRLAA